jgi:hypothetical protein
VDCPRANAPAPYTHLCVFSWRCVSSPIPKMKQSLTLLVSALRESSGSTSCTDISRRGISTGRELSSSSWLASKPILESFAVVCPASSLFFRIASQTHSAQPQAGVSTAAAQPAAISASLAQGSQFTPHECRCDHLFEFIITGLEKFTEPPVKCPWWKFPSRWTTNGARSKSQGASQCRNFHCDGWTAETNSAKCTPDSALAMCSHDTSGLIPFCYTAWICCRRKLYPDEGTWQITNNIMFMPQTLLSLPLCHICRERIRPFGFSPSIESCIKSIFAALPD